MALPRLLLWLLLVIAPPLAQAAEVAPSTPEDLAAYAAVAQALAAGDNRLPGSDAYRASFDAIEAELRRAHLPVERQTYETLVPESEVTLTIDGIAVPEATTLAPNAVALPTTWGQTITGACQDVGEGTLAELDGRAMRGSIAVLDFDTQHLSEVFVAGAQAVILAGNDHTTQWQASALFTRLPISMPVVWLPPAAVARLHLRDHAPHQASVAIASHWRTVRATNLWCKLAATDPLPVESDQHPEALVLSADVDTFGAVPTHCPDLRQAANAALLTQVAVRLAHGPLRRPIYCVFLGSHESAQEGMRYWYYPLFSLLSKDTGTSTLQARVRDLCDVQLEHLHHQAGMIDDLRFVVDTDDDPLQLNGWAHDWLVAQEAEESFAISQDLDQQDDLRKQLHALGDTGSPETAAQIHHRLDALQQDVDTHRAIKSRFNGLRAQLGHKQVTDRAAFAPMTAFLRRQVQRRIGDFTRLREDTLSALRIQDAFKDRHDQYETVVTHFAFDFAQPEARWTYSFAFAGVFDELRWTTFLKQLHTFQSVVQKLHLPLAEQPWIPDDSITYDWSFLSTPFMRSGASAVSGAVGAPGYQLTTIDAPLNDDGMPQRVPCDLSALAPMVEALVRETASVKDLTYGSGLKLPVQIARFNPRPSGVEIQGVELVDLAHASDFVAGPSENAVLYDCSLSAGPNPAQDHYDLSGIHWCYAAPDASGHVFMPMVPDRPGTMAFGYDTHGGINRFSAGGGDLVQLRYGAGGGIFTLFRPADYLTGTAQQILIAGRDAEPHNVVKVAYADAEAFYMDAFRPFKAIGDGIDLIGITPTKPHGIGLEADPRSLLTLDVNAQAAQDLTALNLQRLKTLRSRNIINKPLEKLEADGQDFLAASHQETAAHQLRAGTAHAVLADILGYRIHDPLRENADDLVNAVVILLLLALPFSFAMERLLFGFTSIYKQVGAFSAIFLITFAILYVTHPAFALAEAPLIIFLAFVIILLSSFVTYIMMNKFKYELKAMQGLSSKAHGDQSEGGTALAAIAIGISGMRNRPLKTFLTAMTVALLTFTILVFASFSSELAVVPTALGATRGEHRIEFHTPSFLGMPQRLIDSIATIEGGKYDVYVRGGSFIGPPGFAPEGDDVVMNPKDIRNQKLDGIMVIDPGEVPHLAPLFAPLAAAGASGDLPPVLLSDLLARTIGVAIGDEVRIRGQRLRLAGIFPTKELKAQENIDGTRLVPPDFTATLQANAQHMEGLNTTNTTFKTFDVNDFVFCSPDLIAITTPQAMAQPGYLQNQICLYPKANVDADLDADARDLAEWLDGPVNCASAHGATRYFFTEAVGGSGFGEVIVPLLLGGLIIFSSLLGSIVDRQKEIFTFSALGLAPPDVATLFFAESAVFAVLGGMGGYLISQVVVKVLTLLAAHGLAHVPDVNFSSLSSIVTILIVMATVMLSTIYPAVMAGRSANPGIARRWKMPKPEGDVLSFTFPFTVSAESIGGILAFIREHFHNHGDASLGSFAARNVALTSQPGPGGRAMLGISAEIALAPFDLGVFQRFTLSTRPSDIPGIDEVVVELVRLNGAPTTWIRSNRTFIDDLREQFLRWRSLPIDTVEHYQAQAEGMMRGAHA